MGAQVRDGASMVPLAVRYGQQQYQGDHFQTVGTEQQPHWQQPQQWQLQQQQQSWRTGQGVDDPGIFRDPRDDFDT